MSFALLGIQEISAAKLISPIPFLGFKKKQVGGGSGSQPEARYLPPSVSVGFDFWASELQIT